MKRILLLNFEFPPLGGGGGVAAYKLAKGFIQNGYQVDYLTSGFRELPSFEIVDGINVYRVKTFGRQGHSHATMFSMFTYLLSGTWKGLQLCWKYDYELVNTHFVIPTGPLGFFLSTIFGLKNILSIHGGDIYDPAKSTSPHRHWYLWGVVRFFLNQADRIVAQSSNTEANCRNIYQPNKKIEIIPIPYEMVQFNHLKRTDLGLREDTKYIIGVGRLVKRKDFDTFLRALALLDSAIEGIILGDGPEKGHLSALSKELNISDRIHFFGHVEENRKFQFLSNANLFVLSSLHEGFAIVLQEAMQVGLPIVATNHGGQTDLVKDGVNGYLVPPENPHLLAEGIEKALQTNWSDFKDQLNKFNPKEIAKLYLSCILSKV